MKSVSVFLVLFLTIVYGCGTMKSVNQKINIPAGVNISPRLTLLCEALNEATASGSLKQLVLDEQFVQTYALKSENGTYWVNGYLTVDNAFKLESLSTADGSALSSITSDTFTYQVPLERLNELLNLPGIVSADCAKPVNLVGPKVMGTGGATKVTGSAAISSPAVFVYKTKEDYSHLVPVLMNEARTSIVSYPDPKDLFRGEELCLPTPLAKGYWLDNRGIGPNVAFLSYTYEEYSKMPSPPSIQELMLHILDKNPLTEWHECGRRMDYKNIVSELNKLIEQGFLQK